ncbi:MAG: hypothetical protein CME24_07120 [Gemmatimonadetes bacterium]|nr:hypothetical protein [Gemmatimonadota bacterium]
MVDQSEDETKPTRQWVVAWEPTDWLVATQHGLWLGTPGGRWVSGPYEHALNALLRRPDGLVGAADGGGRCPEASHGGANFTMNCSLVGFSLSTVANGSNSISTSIRPSP